MKIIRFLCSWNLEICLCLISYYNRAQSTIKKQKARVNNINITSTVHSSCMWRMENAAKRVNHFCFVKFRKRSVKVLGFQPFYFKVESQCIGRKMKHYV